MKRKQKIEQVVGRLTINIIAGLLGTVAVLGFFYLLGLLMELIENHLWLLIPFGLIDFILMIKMVSE